MRSIENPNNDHSSLIRVRSSLHLDSWTFFEEKSSWIRWSLLLLSISLVMVPASISESVLQTIMSSNVELTMFEKSPIWR